MPTQTALAMPTQPTLRVALARVAAIAVVLVVVVLLIPNATGAG